ncbi:MAG: ligase-associated DNA damage response endonuclease PdeM [Phycisphaerae bacterium]
METHPANKLTKRDGITFRQALQPQATKSIQVVGQDLILHGCHGVFWEQGHTLFVADTHFGKDHVFRHAGIPVPHAVSEGTLARLDAMLDDFKPQRLIILGDVQHAPLAVEGPIMRALRLWRRKYRDLNVAAVIGNHDCSVETLLEDLDIRSLGHSASFPPFELQHHPTPCADRFVLAGHVHPVFRLADFGVVGMRMPCFYLQEGVLTLPAVGAFTGGHAVQPTAGEEVFVCQDGCVVGLR